MKSKILFFLLLGFINLVAQSPQTTVPVADYPGQIPLSNAEGGYNAVWPDSVFPSPIIGDVIFVSKELGSDTFYVKGSLSSPCKTPWKAKEIANAGDLIYVLPGSHYVATDSAGGGDIEVITGNINHTSLSKDGVYYFFEANTSITSEITASFYPLFYDTVGMTVKVFGYGNFEIKNHASRFVQIDNPESVFVIECESVKSNTNNTGWGKSFGTSRFKYIYGDIKDYYSVNSREFAFNQPTSVPTLSGGNYVMNIGKLSTDSSDQLWVGNKGYYSDCNITFRVGVLDAQVNYLSGVYIGGKNNNWLIDIGTGNITGNQSIANQEFFSYSLDNFTDSLNTTSINCMACISDITLFSMLKVNGAKRYGSKFVVTGNWICKGDSTNYIAKTNGNSSGTGIEFIYNGNFTSLNSPVLKIDHTSPYKIKLTGSFNSNDSPVVQMDATANIEIVNALLENTNLAIPALSSSVANTVKSFYSGFPDGGAVDPDITMSYFDTY